MGEDGYFKEEVRKIMNTREGKEYRKLYKAMSKTGAVIDREKLGLLQLKVNDALRRAQLYAERRIQLRDQVEEKTYYNKRIQTATKERDLKEILRLQKEALRL